MKLLYDLKINLCQAFFKEFKVQCRLVYLKISNYQSLGRSAGMKSFFLLPTGSPKFINGKNGQKYHVGSQLKGQQREMFFWLNPSHIVQIERIKKNLKFVFLLTEIYTLLCLLAYQENTSIFSLRLLHVSIDSFRAFSEYI